MPEPLLVLREVTAGYGRREAVHDVSFEVAAGEVVGLIGPNGSGKTTLLRVASRALRPWSGEVRIGGRDPYELRPREAARLVAVVPQELSAAFPFTVRETVLLGRAPYLSPWGGGSDEDWAQARRAMEAADITHLAERPLDELSGGERQRVVIAQALAQDAPVVLMDEPTTHLDLRHIVEALQLVASMARDQARAVLVVFHDLNLAAAVCDRIHALDGGRVVAAGPPREVLTRRFLAEVYGIEAEVYPHAVTGRPTVVLQVPSR
jgi:ABC-type cobalamin/Fe3+-siderophores transport system ATPase subunit